MVEDIGELQGCTVPWIVVFNVAGLVGKLRLGVSSAVSQGSPTVHCSPGDKAHPNSLSPSNRTQGAAVRF